MTHSSKNIAAAVKRVLEQAIDRFEAESCDCGACEDPECINGELIRTLALLEAAQEEEPAHETDAGEAPRQPASPLPWSIRAMEMHIDSGSGVLRGYEVIDAKGETVFDNQTYYNSAPCEMDAHFILRAITELDRLRRERADQAEIAKRYSDLLDDISELMGRDPGKPVDEAVAELVTAKAMANRERDELWELMSRTCGPQALEDLRNQCKQAEKQRDEAVRVISTIKGLHVEQKDYFPAGEILSDVMDTVSDFLATLKGEKK